jgi:hypothetical protein
MISNSAPRNIFKLGTELPTLTSSTRASALVIRQGLDELP